MEHRRVRHNLCELDSVEAFAAADRQFHLQVLHASGNPFLGHY